MGEMSGALDAVCGAGVAGRGGSVAVICELEAEESD